MEKEALISTVYLEIDIIINEQRSIMHQNAVNEDRRKRLMDFIKNSEALEISSEKRGNLLANILDLEINVQRREHKIVDPIKTDPFKDKRQRKCRHNNAGYCKMKDECVYYHCDKVCDKFLESECKEPKECSYRHPKECKFWLGDARGCLRGKDCKYLHRVENKGKRLANPDSKYDVTDNANKDDGSDPSNDMPKKQSKMENSEIHNTTTDKENICKSNVEQSDEEMVVDVEEVNSKKSDMVDSSNKLQTENNVLKKELERMKRVLTNMNNHIKRMEN